MQYFEWDPNKARSNLKKHGVSFQTATQAFSDPFVVRLYDRTIDGEERWRTIGIVEGHLMLLVVHTTKDDNGDELIRIISARRATPVEKKTYVEENRDAGKI